MARVMLEEWPFHLTHRGNQKRVLFTSAADRRFYLRLLQRNASKFGMKIWAYCLMDNHVHLIASGERRLSIAKALGNTHRAFSSQRNKTADVTGHLWANRFFSTALDTPHLWACVRYVELNPVRAGMVRRATDHTWSSARANDGAVEDPLLDPRRPFPGPIGNWSAWLGLGLDEHVVARLRENTYTGRPTASEDVLRQLEARLERRLRPSPRGPRRARRAESVPETPLRKASP